MSRRQLARAYARKRELECASPSPSTPSPLPAAGVSLGAGARVQDLSSASSSVDEGHPPSDVGGKLVCERGGGRVDVCEH